MNTSYIYITTTDRFIQADVRAAGQGAWKLRSRTQDKTSRSAALTQIIPSAHVTLFTRPSDEILGRRF